MNNTRDLLESLEPGGPPYGVMYGSSIKIEKIIKRISKLLRQHPELEALVGNGDIIEGPN